MPLRISLQGLLKCKTLKESPLRWCCTCLCWQYVIIAKLLHGRELASKFAKKGKRWKRVLKEGREQADRPARGDTVKGQRRRLIVMNFSIFATHATGVGGQKEAEAGGWRLGQRLRLMNDATHSSLSFITQLALMPALTQRSRRASEAGCNVKAALLWHALFAVKLRHTLQSLSPFTLPLSPSLSHTPSHSCKLRTCLHLRLTSMAFDEKWRQQEKLKRHQHRQREKRRHWWRAREIDR